MSSHPSLILASASPRRSALLAQLGIPFEVCVPTVEEVHWLAHPRETVLENAQRKCMQVAGQYPQALILAADTVVAFQGTSVGKPGSLAEAREFLSRFSGQSQEVFTAMALAVPGQSMRLEAVRSVVHFHTLSQARIDRYLAAVDPLDKAGGYNIDQSGDLIIRACEGSRSNIVGLPMERLCEWLTEAGVYHAC